MNQVFRVLLRHYILVFFDDILIYSTSLMEHITYLCVVLSLLRDNKLFANCKNCCFDKRELDYFSHIIFGNGVADDLEKVRIMGEWSVQKNVKELRVFLGLMGYYRRFIKDYGKIAAPLTLLLRKDAIVWSQ